MVHESFNFAALHQLPILFICENNNFSVYTPLEKRQPKRPLHKIAGAHGLSASAGNGNDYNEVSRLAAAAAQSVRDGFGPHFIEFSTFRWREHCGPNFDNDLKYRSLADIQAGLADCPIDRYKIGLAKKGIDVVSVSGKYGTHITL